MNAVNPLTLSAEVFDRAADELEEKGWRAVPSQYNPNVYSNAHGGGVCIVNALTHQMPVAWRGEDYNPANNDYYHALANELGVETSGDNVDLDVRLVEMFRLNDSIEDGNEGLQWATRTLRNVARKIRVEQHNRNQQALADIACSEQGRA